ncbi:MAG: AraC family transcriptional regulator [Eubacteriales bacterium]
MVNTCEKHEKEFANLLTEFVAEATRLLTCPNSNNTNIILNVKNYVEENFSNEIKLSDLADQFYMSREHMCRTFKKQFGYSIYDYILSLRMSNALLLAKNPNIKQKDIALLVGFNDGNYFSKAFKAYHGFSLREARTQTDNIIL